MFRQPAAVVSDKPYTEYSAKKSLTAVGKGAAPEV